MVNGLLRGQLGNWRKHREGIVCEEDDVIRVAANGRNLSIGNVRKGVSSPCVFGDIGIIVVDVSGSLLEPHVFQHCSEPDRIVNLRLLFLTEAKALSITPSLDIPNPFICPDVLIVSD